MAKFFTEASTFDPSQRAEGILDHVLDETSEVTLQEKANEVSVEDALQRESMIKEESSRVKSRVLFITKDAAALEEGSVTQKYFQDFSEVFDEVHVVVLGFAKRKTETIRLAPKVWVYPTVSKSFLKQPFTAYATAKQQLQFTDGFRADVVVSLDAFESGIAGYFIAKKFKRAFQIQVTEDFYTEQFETDDENNKWRLRFARYILKRTDSVRTDTGFLLKKITEHHSKITDLSLLPRYFNIAETIRSAALKPKENLYPQFSFTILYVGTLTHDSTLFRAMDAARRLLQTPSIALVVIGDGPAKEEFQERAKLLGIDAQIIFKPKVDDIVTHMRAADVLICTDTNSEGEEVVVKAAASGLPLIMAKTPLREDLFTDGVDSFLCEPEDTQEYAQKLVKFLNTNAMRTQFSQNAREIVATRIEEDPRLYRFSLRDSIESALYIEEAAHVKEAELQQQKEKRQEAKAFEKEQKAEGKTNPPQPEHIDKQNIGGIEMKMPEVS